MPKGRGGAQSLRTAVYLFSRKRGDVSQERNKLRNVGIPMKKRKGSAKKADPAVVKKKTHFRSEKGGFGRKGIEWNGVSSPGKSL